MINKLKNKKVTKCLLCSNKKLSEIFYLGNFFVSNFVNKKNIVKGNVKCPLNLLYCKNCTLIQLSHIAPQELMYRRFYWYKSGVTKTMRDGLKELYNSSLKHIKLKKKDTVLDIGANDGTLLKYYYKDYTTIGCEPAKNLTKNLKKNCKFVIDNFWSYENLFKILKKNNLSKPKIITAIGMFYDLEDPNKFIRDAAKALHDDGIFIAQLMCLKTMIDKNDIGNICHEHIEFYSLKSLKFLFENNGLEIFKIEENQINGGSYRIYCRKLLNGSIKLKTENIELMMKQFVKRAKENKTKMVNFINKLKKKNKKIFLYGASTKGNTLLQYYGINSNSIPFAAERSPEKWGKYTVGTGIKIISEKKARELNPDYFLVTPWGFVNEFRKREIKWLKKGGKFIVPFPKLRIIGK
jgi:NDP-4-keto-2,6-dideoxyhexose 3-C-methyltransferase